MSRKGKKKKSEKKKDEHVKITQQEADAIERMNRDIARKDSQYKREAAKAEIIKQELDIMIEERRDHLIELAESYDWKDLFNGSAHVDTKTQRFLSSDEIIERIRQQQMAQQKRQ